jgi:hypothetical protein
MVADDFNQDGHQDVLMVGNLYAAEVNTGRYDASQGLYLRGDGYGNFYPAKTIESGFCADGDAKGMAKLITGDGHELVVVGNNSGPVKTYTVNKKVKSYRAGRDDAFALITLKDGTTYKHEFSYGSTYLSQSSRSLTYSSDVEQIVVFTIRGGRREILLQ